MPRIKPADLENVLHAHAEIRHAARDVKDTVWEQRDVEEMLKALANTAENMQILTSRAAERMPQPQDGKYGNLLKDLHEAVEQLGLATLNLSLVSDMLHQQWTDSLYEPLIASDERK